MKVTIIDGTHRQNGMTSRLISAIKEELKTDKSVKIDHHILIKENFAFCKGCNTCTQNNSRCIIQDKTEKIKKDAIDSDLVIFASPIYEYSVSSIMKKFLERCLPLVTFKFGPAPKKSPLKNKQSIIICTSGAPFPFNHLMGITRYPRYILKLASGLFQCKKKISFLQGV